MGILGGAIVFNNQSGSDTQASGYSAQNPTSAVTVNMQIFGSTTTSYASWSGTLSAGDLMYMPSSSGQKFSRITSVNNSSPQSITFADYLNFYGTGYCGGKRRTLEDSDSRRIFQDGSNGDHPTATTPASGWDVEVEYTGTDYTLSSQLVRHCQRSLSGTDPNGSGNKPTIKCSFNSTPVSEIDPSGSSIGSGNKYHFDNIIFATSVYRSDTQPYFQYSNSGTHTVIFTGCEFDGGGGSSGVDLLVKDGAGANTMTFDSCKFVINQRTGATFTGGLYVTAAGQPFIVSSCLFVLDPSATANTNSYGVIETAGGIYVTASAFDGLYYGFYSPTNGSGFSIGSVYYNLYTAVGRNIGSAFLGNIIHSCSIGFSSTSSSYGSFFATGFYNVTQTLGGSFTANESIEFSSDPLTDPAAGDLTLTSSGANEIRAIGSIYTPVSGGAPPHGLNPLRMFDTEEATGGTGLLGMNGGING